MLVLLFVLGTLIGSFLNVCIYRLPRGESVAEPPSHCPNCNTRLKPLDLVPLLSQTFLRARCRYCHHKISWRYFGIEFLTGILFVLAGIWAGPLGFNADSGVWSGDWVKLMQGLVFMATLVVIFWVDYDTRLVPLEPVFLLGFAGVARDAWLKFHGQSDGSFGVFTNGGLWSGASILPAELPQSLWAMIFCAAVLWLLREVFSFLYGREALGFGDVMIVAAIAANLGWNPTLWTFTFTSVVFGSLIGLVLQIPRTIRTHRWAKNRARKYLHSASRWEMLARKLGVHSFRKAVMPFGPMLAIGAIIALLYGSRINESYLQWIGTGASMSQIAPDNWPDGALQQRNFDGSLRPSPR